MSKASSKRNTPELLRVSAVVFAGLGKLASRELHSIGIVNIESTRIRNYDYLSFKLSPDNLNRLRSLRIVEDLFIEIGRLRKLDRKSDLSQIKRTMKKESLISAVNRKNQFSGGRRQAKRRATTFTCFVKQDRDQQLRRKDISQRIESIVAEQFPRWRLSDPAQIEIWVFWAGTVSITVRITDETFKYRGISPPTREGALRPTIAGAMAILASPQEKEIILDPMCGTGTLLLEVKAITQNIRLVGSDIDKNAIQIAASRLKGTAELRVLDAKKGLLYDTPVDCILSNLPWGNQYAADQKLYERLIDNFLRSLCPDGRMVLLTGRVAMLEKTLRDANLVWKREAKVLVRGKWATIFAVKSNS